MTHWRSDASLIRDTTHVVTSVFPLVAFGIFIYLYTRLFICSCFVAVLIVCRGQLLDAVECGGYEAKLHAVDDDGDVEVVDPEVKAAKVTAKI